MSARRPTIASIIARVAAYYDLPPATLRGQDRSHPLIEARHVAMYVARQVTSASLPQLGREFGGRDHTAILHAVRKISRLRQQDEHIERLVTSLLAAPVASHVSEGELLGARLNRLERAITTVQRTLVVMSEGVANIRQDVARRGA